ncbi:MAG: ABC transporter permease [Acidobacteria bacterium]|nr:MAG: ABC transporter permease [Acidobacteriota bacterium]
MLSNLRQLFRCRGLIQILVARELKARYRGSVLGFFWSFVNPLLLLLVYSFVFTVIIQRGEIVDLEPYAVFLFCGLLPWTWFSASLSEGANALLVGGNLIKKVKFPAEILPVVAVVSNMIHFVFGLPILFGFLWFYAIPLRLTELVWFPVVMAVQFILTLGLVMVLAALTVHFRDIKDLLANLLTLWFFATPIIYPMSVVPPRGKAFMDLNPFSHLAISYQEILFYDGPFGHWKWLLALAVAGAVLFLLGYWLFDRLRDSFADEV